MFKLPYFPSLNRSAGVRHLFTCRFIKSSRYLNVMKRQSERIVSKQQVEEAEVNQTDLCFIGTLECRN